MKWAGPWPTRMAPVQAVREEEGDQETQTKAASSGVGYFFFAGELAEEVFGAVVQDRSAAGEGIFLGCLGFFASRLPRS